jgi:oligopeptide transport system substrate-binding protein
VPEPRYFDGEGNPLPEDAPAEAIAVSEYLIRLRPGIRYQPHPAFAQGPDGAFRYHQLTPGDLDGINRLGDFPETGTRELMARTSPIRSSASPPPGCTHPSPG